MRRETGPYENSCDFRPGNRSSEPRHRPRSGQGGHASPDLGLNITVHHLEAVAKIFFEWKVLRPESDTLYLNSSRHDFYTLLLTHSAVPKSGDESTITMRCNSPSPEAMALTGLWSTIL